MKQMTFADVECTSMCKQPRNKLFLIEMDQVLPWMGLVALIEPHYPKVEGDRPSYPLMAMLRFYLMQYWLSLRQATNVYITRVHAPSSTKNQGNKRSSEVHQKMKRNQYYFGMKTNIDVDAEPSLGHSMVGTEAQVADVTQPTAAWRRESGAYLCPLHRGGEAARARGNPSHLANSGMAPHLKEV